ncbi:hypothetical protein COHA_003556 [Chlorella ohadii]|uniref:Uncharacterized protein n=1 Tax=Chlorella ohadii TaxID=2649997 RepID=A0AAD5H760_9CHLO|nr:hypothetical protein COHA_003556 [Chlorella ohadii]
MAGPGSQRNKPHKAGRKAGLSAREKHRNTKAGPDVDVPRLWAGLLAAFSSDDAAPHAGGGKAAQGGMDVDAGPSGAAASAALPLAMTTLSAPERRRLRFTLLPPPEARDDPLAIVELGRCAEVLLLALPGDVNTVTIDDAGSGALGILRALGLPAVTALVQSPAASEGKNPLKERAAAKKHATNALQEQLAGDHKLLPADTAADFKAVLRHLSDAPASVPHWRQQRPAVMVEAAEFVAQQQGEQDGSAALGTLLLRGYVRGLGLSANQAVHVSGAGDFQLAQIDGPAEPPAANDGSEAARRQQAVAGAAAMDLSAAEGSGGLPLLARPQPGQQESLVRENEVDPLAGEQTWPTEEELMEAEARAPKPRKRRLPKGTSDYQAAWILDDSDLDDTDLESEVESGDEGRPQHHSDDESLPDLEPNVDGPGGSSFRDVDTGTEFGMDYDEEEEEERGSQLAGMIASQKERRRQEEDDQMFPDEVDTPEGVAARQRFDKYRGLKSFRTSAWDPRESLPQDYARVFAFENFKRAHKRAKEAAARVGAAGDPDGVAAGTYVQLQVAAVPADAAARVLERVAASQQRGVAPLMVFGLLQHECKLSVQHYGVRKAAGYEEPIANKEALLLVNGLRAWHARPVFSTDEHGADKHKMERFLHEGRPSIATVYAPIAYPPLPLLAFKLPESEGGLARLAATGSLRSCDPDRIVLKKIVLSGYPVKVHKTKAVVRFMFHNPDDVRWFRPVELWTKAGRRGRIREPIGTHGSMKCIFDGPLRQQDAVCMSLYKRVYPKWPEDLRYVA